MDFGRSAETVTLRVGASGVERQADSTRASRIRLHSLCLGRACLAILVSLHAAFWGSPLPAGLLGAAGSSHEASSATPRKVPGRPLMALGVGPASLLSTTHVTALAISSDGRFLATGGVKHGAGLAIYIWSVSLGAKVREIATLPDIPPPYWLTFSPDDTLLAAGNVARPPSKHTLEVWAVKTGDPTGQHDTGFKPLLDDDRVSAEAFSPDGKYLAAGIEGNTRDAAVRIWHLGSWQVLPGAYNISGTADSLAFAANGNLLAVGGTSTSVFRLSWAVTVFDLLAAKRLATYEGCYGLGLYGPGKYGVTLTSSPVGTALAATGPGGVCAWDVRTGKKYPKVKIGRVRVLGIAFSSDGTDLVGALSDGTARVWNVETSREVRRCNLGKPPSEYRLCSFSSGGRLLACAERHSLTVHVWDVETCSEKNKFSM